MKRFSLLALLSVAVSWPVAARPKCGPPPTLVVADARSVRDGETLVTDRAIEGSAVKQGRPLSLAPVRLYADGRLVRSTMTDRHGHFLLADLHVGHFRLSFRGLGTFEVEVVPPHTPQQSFYGFGQFRGCLHWGKDTN